MSKRENQQLAMHVPRAMLMGGFFFLASCSTVPHAIDNNPEMNEIVVLLHGLGRGTGSMSRIEKSLKEHGYETCNVKYPSRGHPIEDLVEQFVMPQLQAGIRPTTQAVHFVTHSMGGIVARYLLQEHDIPHLGHVVMLSPPNQGSEVVDRFGSWWLFGVVMGPAGRQLGTARTSLPRRLERPTYSVGIITGKRTINPIFSRLIPGDDDGKVSVERARLDGMADFLVVPVRHPFIMRDGEVIRQILYFLQHGAFWR